MASRGGPEGSPKALGSVLWPSVGLLEACCLLYSAMLGYLERSWRPSLALGGPLGAILGHLGCSDRSRTPPSHRRVMNAPPLLPRVPGRPWRLAGALQGFQDGPGRPSRPPRWPNMHPRWPKMAPRGPRRAQMASMMAEDGQRWLKITSDILPRGYKTAPRRLKVATDPQGYAREATTLQSPKEYQRCLPSRRFCFR